MVAWEPKDWTEKQREILVLQCLDLNVLLEKGSWSHAQDIWNQAKLSEATTHS